jgi:hypothetical protein
VTVNRKSKIENQKSGFIGSENSSGGASLAD